MQSLVDRLVGRPENTNRAQQGMMDITDLLKENKLKAILSIISSLLIGIVVSSFIIQLLRELAHKQDAIYILNLFTDCFTSLFGIGLMLIVTAACISTIFRFHRVMQKNYYVDEDDHKIKIVKEDDNAHWLTETEREELFNIDDDIHDVTGDILGLDKKGRILSFRDDVYVPNYHRLIIGISGIGKSVTILENAIIQCMRRGESMYITDTKGDLYKKYNKLLRREGYVVRLLNFIPEELRNSDAIHLFKYLKGGNVAEAKILATCIIENTSGGKMEYWEINELNGYMAFMLYLSTNDAIVKAGRDTLAEMYNMATTMTLPQLHALFSTLPETHPAKRCWNIFSQAEPRNQGQIMNGMGVKLGFLADENAQQIVSHDETDLLLPIRKKCAYFVVIPDNVKTDINVIASLMFTISLMKQTRYYDTRPKEQRGKVTIPVNYLLDEFYSTGMIPNFGNYISTVRSRKIKITVILQSYAQLEEMYDEKAAETIAGQFAFQILLRASEGDKTTAEYWCRLCGKQKRLTDNSRYSDYQTDVVHAHNYETKTEGSEQVDLLPVNACYTIPNDRMVLHISGYQPYRPWKYFADDNPFTHTDLPESIPGRHKPKWRHDLEEATKNRTAIKPEGYEKAFDPDTGEIVEEAEAQSAPMPAQTPPAQEPKQRKKQFQVVEINEKTEALLNKI